MEMSSLACRLAAARDALRRQFACRQLRDLRRRIMPIAARRGYLADDGCFRDVS
jgi:hypothetical protein